MKGSLNDASEGGDGEEEETDRLERIIFRASLIFGPNHADILSTEYRLVHVYNTMLTR